jgi:hypothetical protein
MAFDASRPVPWRRLLRLLAIYLVGINFVLWLIARDQFGVSTVVSSLVGGAVYVVFTVLLVKLGWDPFAFSRRKAPPPSPSAPTTPPPKAAPTPTKRTNAGNPRAKRH